MPRQTKSSTPAYSKSQNDPKSKTASGKKSKSKPETASKTKAKSKEKSKTSAKSAASATPAKTSAPPTAGPVSHPLTLCIDIGGTGIKAIILDPDGTPITQRSRVLTPRPAIPSAVMDGIKKAIAGFKDYDRISVGFPGVVHENVVYTAPNLDDGWEKFPLGPALQELTNKPTRVINDADVQGYGVIEGKGVEMVITLGTGMGSALFMDGRLVPNLELGHHPLTGKKTYENLICDKELKKIGKKDWKKRVQKVIDQIMPIWNPRVLYMGGGNSRHARTMKLPDNVKIVDNLAGLLGGIALWKYE
jgi:polyphosphate glucokinase